MRSSYAFAVALAGLTFVVGAGVAHSQEWPALDRAPSVDKTGANDVAVLVAVEDYAFLPDVPGARTNLADWESFLVDGLGVRQTFLLTNQQAVREQILKSVERAASQARPGGTLWFVFIGHGAPNAAGNDGLLIGADGQQNPDSMNARGVAQLELIAALQKGQQTRTVVVFDACFSGRDAAGRSLAEGTMPVLPVSAPSVAASTVVLTAAAADEFAGDLPGMGRPAFSYLLLGALRGWADNGDGSVTAEEATRFATRELLRIPDRQQTPQLAGDRATTLAAGVSERRPESRAAATATAPTPTATQPPDRIASPTATAEAQTKPVRVHDGIPDNPMFFKMMFGYVFGSRASGKTPVAGAMQLGLKVNAFLRNRVEVRPFAFGQLFAERAPSAPAAGDTIPGFNGGASYTVAADDKIESANVAVFVLGAGAGYAYRSEYGKDQDFVIDLGGGAGVGLPISERCQGYVFNGAVECTRDENNDLLLDKTKHLHVMTRLGLHVGGADLALQLNVLPGEAKGFLGYLSFGYSFDP